MSLVDELPRRPLSFGEGRRIVRQLSQRVDVLEVTLVTDQRQNVVAIVAYGPADLDALVFDKEDRRWKLLAEWSADQDDRDLELADGGRST